MPVRITDPGRGVTLAFESPRIYTGAFCAAGLAPVTSVTLETSHASATPVTLHIPAIYYGAQASLSGDATRFRPSSPLPETVSALEQITGRQPTEISVLVNNREIGRLPLLLMDVWSWPHEALARMVAATYVLPGDRSIARVVTEVFGADPGQNAVEGSGRWGGIGAAVAIYRHLSESWAIRYDPPRVLTEGDMSGTSHQKIASPQDVLSAQNERKGAGNCLDLSLFFAGCFESMGLQPLLFFVGDPGSAPSHAFPGLWTVRGRRFQPLLTDKSDLHRRLRAGEIVAFEATGICSGDNALSPEDAVASARARFESDEPIHVIDVTAARPPAGQVRPLELPNAPVVQKIVWQGQTLALETGARRLETMHLLYGLCTAGGETTRIVFQRAGVDPKRVSTLLEANRSPKSQGGLPAPTQNYELCWSAARSYARAGGHSRVEEIDIWWALVENPGRNLPRVLKAAGADLVRVAREVAHLGGRPGVHSISVDLPSRME
ncbi:MAG TPA: Clp protease N-terminal domain-containing protein [Candidatus Eisenbacteria bacterium]|nr:Clp protease N-terminal domain-containing protein [Candidatus Eisenbacteria bacterium]